MLFKVLAISPHRTTLVFVGVGFQFLGSVRVLVGTMLAGVLVVVRMLIRAMRVLVCVMMVVGMAVLVRVLMRMRHTILMGVFMRMRVAVDVLMRMVVFVFTFHVSPRTPFSILDASSGLSVIEKATLVA